MLDNASHTDAFNAKPTLGGKTTTYIQVHGFRRAKENTLTAVLG